jgi:hypothetical protein
MSRAKKVFERVVRNRPELVLCKDVLVVAPTDQILRGFVLETTTEKNMIYLWRVIMPLYQPRKSLYLDYSNRIADGDKIFVDPKDYQQSARVIESLIVPHFPALKKLSHVGDFFSHIDWMIGNGSSRFRFDLALTYHRIGDVDRALSILKSLPHEIEQYYEAFPPATRKYMKSGPNPLEDAMRQVAHKIAVDPSGFPKLLDQWVQQNVERHGLQETWQRAAA